MLIYSSVSLTRNSHWLKRWLGDSAVIPYQYLLYISVSDGCYCDKNQVHFNVNVLCHSPICHYQDQFKAVRLGDTIKLDSWGFGFLLRAETAQIHSYWLNCLVPVNHFCNVWRTEWGLRLRWEYVNKPHLWGVQWNQRLHRRRDKVVN